MGVDLSLFDEYYDIRVATKDDIPSIKKFIDNKWKKGHILSQNAEFFNYEMVIDGNVDFVIAVSKEDGNIDGLEGFIPSSLKRGKQDMWGVLWKTTEKAKPLLGIEIKRRLCDLTGGRYELGVGANPNTTVPILRFYGYHVSKLKHYYMLNSNADFRIAYIQELRKSSVELHDVDIERVTTIDALDSRFDYSRLDDKIPYKDRWYIKHRYFDHPIYSYKLYVAKDSSDEVIIATREQEYLDSKVLRLVDVIGDELLLGKLGSFFSELVKNYEYIDVYFGGIDDEYVKRAGFVERYTDDVNIIPNYFSPFERKNVDIWVDSNVSNCTFFKADGDQDRPN